MPDGLCRQFATALVTSTGFSPLVLDKARLCLTDFLTGAFSTGEFPWVQQARQVARANSAGVQAAPIIGTDAWVSVQDAAFANAVAGHSLVRDDMHLGSVSHLGVLVIPTVLALSAREPVSGRRLLEAIVCGYEAGCKLGNLLMDVQTAKKFRPTGLIGAFAAAAAGSRLAGLDEAQTANALGFAANYISGLNEWAEWGSDDMYFHPGIAARNGITAMQLARAGAIAAAGSLDGKAGLFAALGKALPATVPLPFTGTAEIMRVFFKQVPACNYAQTAAQVAAALARTGGFESGQITRVSVRVPHAAANYPGCDYAGPFDSILQARMSIHFNVASALLHGDFADSHYRDFGNAGVAAMAAKTDISIDKPFTAAYPGRQGAAIDIELAGGKVISSGHDDVLAANPDEVTNRFLAAAQQSLGPEPARSLLAGIMALESAADTGIFRLLAKPA